MLLPDLLVATIDDDGLLPLIRLFMGETKARFRMRPCIRRMNEYQYQEFKSLHKGISMPLVNGKPGEIQRQMFDGRASTPQWIAIWSW